MEHGVDTPTSVKAFPVEKPKLTSQPHLQIQTQNNSQKRENDRNLATWNVSSVFRAGALRNLTQDLNRFNVMIVATQDKRWKGSDILDTGDYDLQQW